MDIPDGFTDAVYVDTQIHFSWKDRIRILFGRTCHVDSRTWTEHRPGNLSTDRVRVSVDRIFPPRHRLQMGVVEVPGEETSS